MHGHAGGDVVQEGTSATGGDEVHGSTAVGEPVGEVDGQALGTPDGQAVDDVDDRRQVVRGSGQWAATGATGATSRGWAPETLVPARRVEARPRVVSGAGGHRCVN